MDYDFHLETCKRLDSFLKGISIQDHYNKLSAEEKKLFDVIISSRFSYLIEYQLSSGYYVVNEGRLEDFFLSGSFEDRYTQHLGNTNRAKEIEEKTLIDLSNRIDEKFQEALTDFYTTTAQSNNIRTAIAVLAFIISLIALIR